MENSIDANVKVTIDEDACYLTFYNELTVQSILSAETQVIGLLDQKNIELSPIIGDLTNIGDDDVKIEVRDFGKIISVRALSDRCSGVWIVGTKGNTKMLTNLLNKTFLESRLHIVDTLEEAKTAARAIKGMTVPFLEQDLT